MDFIDVWKTGVLVYDKFFAFSELVLQKTPQYKLPAFGNVTGKSPVVLRAEISPTTTLFILGLSVRPAAKGF